MKLYNLLFFCVFILVAGCNKDDDNTPANPINQLPPATQTGEGTFGCLLDGKAFEPIYNQLNSTTCFYQYVDGGFYFAVKANKINQSSNFISLGCYTESMEISEGVTYQLKERIEGNACGLYTGNIYPNYTSSEYTGELTITKLDFENHIVSGTFWYDVQDENGVVHQIREGRFDMHFTT